MTVSRHRFGNAADGPERVRCYDSDMTDAEWQVIRTVLPVPAWLEGRGGRPEGYRHRMMLDAVRYVVDNGVKWVNLPCDFPPYRRVHAFARRWQVTGLLAELHDRLRDKVRQKEGREVDPTAAIVDSQSLRAAANIPRSTSGWDDGKKVGGRKRHLVVDCLGLVLAVAVPAAGVQDRDAAVPLLDRIQERPPAVRGGNRRHRPAHRTHRMASKTRAPSGRRYTISADVTACGTGVGLLHTGRRGRSRTVAADNRSARSAARRGRLSLDGPRRGAGAAGGNGHGGRRRRP